MPHAPDLAGCVLDGRYELHELIGEGTFGRVYRGHDRRLARGVAIKVIKPWWAEDPEWADSFEREAQLLARVSDPGIVQIYDVGQADEGLYYITELVEGESLGARLKRRGRLAPWDACEITEQLCRALEQAHGEHIVHRDVKPANVLISTRGQVKVGDLGIARLAAEGTTDGGTATIVGTPRYMAPEQASGEPVTPATDVYSAGIVLFEMLVGHAPFNGDSAVEIALRHVQQPVPPLPAGTPRSLERVVRQALAKDPAERYQSAAAMADELARARARAGAGAANGTAKGASRAAEPTWVAPRFTPRRTVNPSARRRTIAVFVLALGLLGALALAAGVFTPPPNVVMPRLHGLGSRKIDATLRARHLMVAYTRQYDERGRPGTAVAQTPAPGTKIKQGSTIDVVLSRGPRPVDVPKLTGKSSGDATGRLHQVHLGARLTMVAAPGTAPGIVTGQSPVAGHSVHEHSTVTLLVAETPNWRSVTSLQGGDREQSVPFRIRGSQWRIVYTMSYQGTCNFVLFCSGPTAQVTGPGAGSSFDLSDGGTQTRVVKSGPGSYQLAINPGWDSATWSVEIQDYY
jgi:eukaryotic-like serine/threonine-protein kinase